MSGQNSHYQSAPSLAGLELGAPLGGGTSGGALPGHTHTTTSSTSGSGLTSGQGYNQTGDNYASSKNNAAYSSGQTGDNYAGSFQGYDAKNSTSGDRGIGGGRGGPTAYESDASKVGERAEKAVTGTSEQQGSNYGSAGVAAGMGAGHHDQGLTSGSGLTSGTGHHHDHSSHSHGQTGTGLTSGSGLTGSSHDHHTHGSGSGHGHGIGSEIKEEIRHGHGLTSQSGFVQHERGTEVLDSVTGQPHFTSSATGAGLAGAGVGAGIGAGAAGLSHGQSQTQGQGHGQGQNTTTSSHGGLKGALGGGHSTSSGGPTGPTSELRKELDLHKSGEGLHDVYHAESKGPHGLVFDESTGKYVHRRELDHKGSTGVPLK